MSCKDCGKGEVLPKRRRCYECHRKANNASRRSSYAKLHKKPMRMNYRNKSLWQARISRGWSKAYVAIACDAPHSSVCAWENDYAVPREYTMKKLCTLFGMAASDLGYPQYVEVTWSSYGY